MCGLFGIVTKKDKQNFDYTTFCTLGISNDSRGGDSCGIFIDGYYDYGTVGNSKYFQCHFLENKFLKNLKESTIAFGHCRKASIGKIDETTAQPVIITEGNVIKYVLMHNGTIYNYKELAEKYIPNIDITGMTDSQVMARIFYYNGYDSLNEYVGGAVFVIADYRELVPKILLFKGESKKNKWSTKKSEERPLNYCIDPKKKELVFSSIGSYIMALRPNVTTWDMQANVLLEFDGTDLIEVQEFSRNNVYQTKESTTFPSYNHWYNSTWDMFGTSDDVIVYDDYISVNLLNNTYHGKGKSLHGRILLTSYGRIVNETSKKSYYKEIYFWNGVALKSVACFRFLSVLKKDSLLDDKRFDKTYENVIRYLSIDGIYCDNNKWYKAISTTERILYTGILNMLTSTSSTEFKDGNRISTKYGNTYKALDFNDKSDCSFKQIKEECKSLMKQLRHGFLIENVKE